MRVFYIFKINKELKYLTRKNTLNLYYVIENMYNLRKEDYSYGVNIFQSIAEMINRKDFNINLFNANRSNESYTKFNNIHMIYDYYSNERTKLIVNNSHLMIITSKQIPFFLNSLKFDKNLFVCDFNNKDFFWVDDLKYS